MAKADRNTDARAAVTGENHAQALSWIRAHGLLHGLAPDAASAEQQALEAALLFALTRPVGGLHPLPLSGSLFGVAKASPGPGNELRLWPVTGSEAEVLVRLLPSRTSDTVPTVSGVAGLRWVRDGKYLALSRVGASEQVLLAAQARDIREAGRLSSEAGLLPLWDQAGTALEDTPRRVIDISLAESAPAWSRALRRPLLAREVASHWTSREPTLAELAGDASALMPRPHGPASRRPQIVHVRSTRGGTGCSTLSVQIAYGLTRAGRTVALVTDDAMLRHVAKDAADDTALWHEPFAPAGGGRLLAASHGYYGERLDVRAAEATSRGEVVVLDVGGRPPAELAGLPAADLTVVADNYRARDWVQVDVIDRRPEQVRVFAALDEHFARWWRPSTEQADADRLRTALDREFFYYAFLRLQAPDEVDVYDVDDADDVEEWWDLGAHGSPGHPDDVLPPEDAAPLDLWRRHFLDFITPEGQRRHPDNWDEVRDSWIAHNRLRNLQRLSPDGDPIEDLAVRASEFLATAATEHDSQPRVATVEEQETWRTAKLTQWLDARFAVHLRHDAAYLPRPAAETVMAVLDTRFLTYGPHHAEGFAALADEVRGDGWWDVAAAARSLDGAAFPLPPGPDEDADVREQGWAAFLAAVEDEGARRHGEVWSEVRAHWVEHHRRLEQDERAPFAPTEEELPALRRQFAAALAPVTAAGVDWDSVIGRWVAGVRSDAARVRDFDDLIERRQRPGTGEETAAALLRGVRGLGLDPRMPVVMITNMYRPMGGPEAVAETAEVLRGHGVVALCTVRQRQAFEELLFAPSTWNDDRVKPVQEELGAVVSSALKDARKATASPGRE
ncbi:MULTISPECIES: hypothetical protein [Streptomyces]|uniref:CobQ/CobB/MinD/ParA nucleotide binding domain-containing protein n=1 Tax=Streptomyces griseiscabiei TaxID=2993540 RepID=A0ABU4LJS7_9ACTN|nr:MULTISPECIES: hypothetical protein [Streptomyces]MBZ3908273.1 hypothetical protein [Streptomyces griseiscabiei]MDX2915685.1 hypothetical protein [Streptomyces griseiscabiei]